MHVERVPRLPVFDWHYLRTTESLRTVTSVLDAPVRVWTTSGRAGIAVALLEAGLGVGDSMLLPTYHCPTMVAPPAHLGLDVEYFPLSESGRVDLDYIETRFRSGGIRVILIAHYFGFPQPVRAVRDLCDRYGVLLIEDCAHAMYGMADGKPIGSWGDFAIASLTKFLPVTSGGCVVSYRRPLSNKLRYEAGFVTAFKSRLDAVELAARYGRPARLGALLRPLFDAKNALRGAPRRASLKPTPLAEASTGYFGFDEIQALTAPPDFVTKLAMRADRNRIVARRRQVFERLAEAVSRIHDAVPVHEQLPDTVAPYVFPILAERPDETFRTLRKQGIPVFRWDWLWPETPVRDGDLGIAWSRKVLQLPCHQDLSDGDIERIAQAIEHSGELA